MGLWKNFYNKLSKEKYEAYSDDELINQWILTKDELAVNEFFERYKETIFSFAMRKLRNFEEAETVYQHCILTFLKNPECFKDKENREGYFSIIAYNYMKKELFSNSRSIALDRIMEERDIIDDVDNEEKIIWQQNETLLEEAINNLPEKYKDTMDLIINGNLKPRQVAEIKKNSAKKVSNEFNNACKLIKQYIKQRIGNV